MRINFFVQESEKITDCVKSSEQLMIKVSVKYTEWL